MYRASLPENDILKLQKQLDGRMTLMGGIDATIDREDATEEEIRADVRRACSTYGPGGHFIPCMTYGLAGTIYPKTDRSSPTRLKLTTGKPIISDEAVKNAETGKQHFPLPLIFHISLQTLHPFSGNVILLPYKK